MNKMHEFMIMKCTVESTIEKKDRHIKKYNRVRIFTNVILTILTAAEAAYGMYFMWAYIMLPVDEVFSAPGMNVGCFLLAVMYIPVAIGILCYRFLCEYRAQSIIRKREEKSEWRANKDAIKIIPTA